LVAVAVDTESIGLEAGAFRRSRHAAERRYS
jgi:hypothetical protein